MSSTGRLWVLVSLLAVLLAKQVLAATRINSFLLVEEIKTQRAHRVTRYRQSQFLIVRRGGEMTFRVNLDEALDPEQSLTLQVSPFPIFDPEKTHINSLGGGLYDVVTRIAPDAPVGSYAVGVRLSDRTFVVNFNRRVAVVFNPWHSEDLAYFTDDSKQTFEFVENEQGITYRGSTRMVQSVRWYYGQFIPEALIIAMHHLNSMDETSRRDPALVARFFSAISGHQNAHPNGIMVGRWEKNFPNGVNPSAWQGSDSILRSYLSQRFRPVQYAQCWVFAAVLTTLMRTLGIAARTVSNFDSAHETPVASMTYNQEILRYWDRNARIMIAEVGMIWNFHAWTDVYLTNRYAVAPYDGPGWQTIDGTPQELSDGKYQLGPAPLSAVRAMQKMRFDTSFVMAEVSSRIRNMMVQCPFFVGGRMQFLPRGCRVINDMGHEPRYPTGTILSTKAIGSFGEARITAHYHNRVNGYAPAAPRVVAPPAGSGNTVRAMAAHNGQVEPLVSLPLHVPEYKQGDEIAVYHYDNSGISMAVSITPITIGEPLEIIVNFACEDRTDDFDQMLRSRDRATRHAILDENSETTKKGCPDISLVSFRLILKFSDYAGQEYETIADVKANVVLRSSNNHFKSFRFISKDYLSKAAFPISDYVRATVMATDHSTSPDKDIVLFGVQSAQLLPPKIQLVANRTTVATGAALENIVSTATISPTGVISGANRGASIIEAAGINIHSRLRGGNFNNLDGNNVISRDIDIERETERVVNNSNVRVNIRFVNPLNIELTNCALTLNADELGFAEKKIALRSIPAKSTFLYVHEFDTVTALPGTHFYHAILTSNELPPIVGEITFRADVDRVTDGPEGREVDVDVAVLSM